MKITYGNFISKNFGELDEGELFALSVGIKKKFYIKTDPVFLVQDVKDEIDQASYSDEIFIEDTYNAVDLETGEHSNFSDTEAVVKVVNYNFSIE